MMGKRFNILIGVEDSETGEISFQHLSRAQAKVISMALNMEFKYDPESDEVEILEDGLLDEKDLAEDAKEDRLLIGRIKEEEIISNDEYRFKFDVKVEEKRYDNYYKVHEEFGKLYHSSLESYREELDRLTDNIDKLP